MRLLVLCLALTACKPSDEITYGTRDTSPDPEDTDTSTVDCSGDIECEDWEICSEGQCIAGDHNNAMDEADSIDWEESVMGYLQTADDWDWFALETDGGQFARISTRPTDSKTGEPAASEEMNTVVATYDAEGNLLSWEDDYPTGGSVSGYDSIVYTYFADPGTYWIAVMDQTGGFDMEEEHYGSDFTYVLTVQDYGSPPDEPDSIVTPGADREISEGFLYPIPVLLESKGDSDFIEITLPYGDCPVLVRGSSHLDGTDATPRVRLYSAKSDLLTDQPALGTGGMAFYPDVDGGKAMIEVSDADGGGGDNHWFFAIVSADEQGYGTTVEGEDVDYQVDAEPNDQLEKAQLLDQIDVETSSGSPYTAAYFWGTQDGEGDEDWYAFHAEAGSYLNAWASADYIGSLMDPAIEVYDSGGLPLTSWYDGSDSAPDLYDFPIETTGTHYLRVYDETGASKGGAAHFYRFSLFVTSFETQ